MTIVVTGGGSGGHITPILAVASELKKLQPEARIVYIGQKGDSLADIPAKHEAIDAVYAVQAGKFRRYHGEGLKQLLDIHTVLKNIRDALRVAIGIIQSKRLIKQLKPDIVFTRGGFVSVPVALGARLNHVPFITHDSDSIPSLANRIIARWALLHAVALPKEVYSYPTSKTITTGIPLNEKFVRVDERLRSQYRQEVNMPASAKLLFIIGGGNGAQSINLVMAEAMPHLLHEFPELQVVHQVGRQNEESVQKLYTTELSTAEQGRVVVKGFMEDVYRYSGAADVIITRAGATQLAEFALQGKATIVIPAAFLTGGHQVENARYLEAKKAAVVVTETELQENPNVLAARVSALLKDDKQREELGENFAAFGTSNAANRLAQLLLDQIQTTNNTAHDEVRT